MAALGEIAFGLTSDPNELRDLFDVPFRSATAFIDTTLAGIATHMELEHDEVTSNVRAERRKSLTCYSMVPPSAVSTPKRVWAALSADRILPPSSSATIPTTTTIVSTAPPAQSAVLSAAGIRSAS